VVLATGDFSADRVMKAKLATETAARTEAVNPGSTGDGHKLATALGAQIVNGDIVHGPRLRFVPPARVSLVRRLPPWRIVGHAARLAAEHLPSALLRPILMGFVTTALGVEANLYKQGAILVNAHGRRFADELGSPQDHLPDQPDAVAHVVLDSAIAETFSRWPNFVSTAPGVAYAYIADYRRSRRDIFHPAATLEDLAGRIGVPPSALAKTVADSNASALAAGRPALTRAPFNRARTDQALRRLHRRWPARHRAPASAGRGRCADAGPLRRGLRRAGRSAALWPRPSPGLGIRVRAHRWP
jgi:hypothetical protein